MDMAINYYQHGQTTFYHPTLKRFPPCHRWYFVVLLLYLEIPRHYLAAQDLADSRGQELVPLAKTSLSLTHKRDCNCLNGSDCDRETGFCPDGCREGWTRVSEFGPCRKIAPRRRMLMSGGPSAERAGFGEGDLSLDSHDRYHDGDSSFLRESLYAFQFEPRNVCVYEDGNRTFNSWRVNLPAWYMLRALFLHVEGLSESRDNQTILVLTSTSSFSKLELACEVKPSSSSSSFCSLVLENSTRFARFLQIETKKYGDVVCPPLTITKAFVLGLPVCPYSHWGSRCQRRCGCTCGDVECHPLTGECSEQDFSCQPGFYGQMCDRKCPLRCDVSPLVKGCHRITGVCKACARLNSKSCTPEDMGLSPWDVVNRLRCRTEETLWDLAGTEWLKSENEEKSSSLTPAPVTSEPTEIASSGTDGYDGLDKGLILVMVVGCIIMLVMLLLCIWAVFEVIKKREWRKERESYLTGRWRDRLSLKTLDGFDLEFMEMEAIRSGHSIAAEEDKQKNSSHSSYGPAL